MFDYNNSENYALSYHITIRITNVLINALYAEIILFLNVK